MPYISYDGRQTVSNFVFYIVIVELVDLYICITVLTNY